MPLRAPLSLTAGVRGVFSSELDALRKKALRRDYGKSELVLKQLLHTVLLSVVSRDWSYLVEAPLAVGGIVFTPANLLPFLLPHRLVSLRITARESPCWFCFPESPCQGLFHTKGNQVKIIIFFFNWSLLTLAITHTDGISEHLKTPRRNNRIHFSQSPIFPSPQKYCSPN